MGEPTTDERRYTLAEARRELAAQECGRYGHDYQIMVQKDEPVALECSRCGRGWPVGPETQ